MIIELKNIQYNEVTEAFTANLYIDGKKAGYVHNRGDGHDTQYDYTGEQGKQQIAAAEVYCKTLPDKHFRAYQGNDPFSIPMTLEVFINEQLDNYLRQKDQQAFRRQADKAQLKGVIVGVPGESFRAFNFKIPIAEILAMPKGSEIITKAIRTQILPEVQNGKMVLNTNIPEPILKEAGLTTWQYVSQTPSPSLQKKQPRNREENYNPQL